MSQEANNQPPWESRGMLHLQGRQSSPTGEALAVTALEQTPSRPGVIAFAVLLCLWLC